MRAWQVQQAGEPGDVLVLAAVPDPEPGPGQVLVRVLGAAANFPDVLMCRGLYQVRPPYPFTPGIELCGEIVSAGPGVTGKIGTIKRTGGSTQATYDGHPLYTYIGDRGPGQDSGNKLNLNGGLWLDVPVGG